MSRDHALASDIQFTFSKRRLVKEASCFAAIGMENYCTEQYMYYNYWDI